MKQIRTSIIICVSIFISSIGFSQNQIYNMEEVSLLLDTTVENGQSFYTLNSLAYDLVPSIYYKNGQETFTDSTVDPIRVILGVDAIEELYQPKQGFKKIEIIIIQLNNVNELGVTINADALNNFENLRYIYFSCSFNICANDVCAKERISNMVNGQLPVNTKIIYTSEINE